MIFLRSLLFNCYFFLLTGFVLLVGYGVVLLPDPYPLRVIRFWSKGTMWGLKTIVGLTFTVEGIEHVRPPCIVASKHQSAWDTIVFHCLFENPALAAKKELEKLMFGAYMRRLKLLIVDRRGGLQGMKRMMGQAEEACRDQRPIIIFPEGKRSEPGEKGVYQKGVATLYQQLNIPIVPMALNSGFFWGRRGFIKKPGVIRLVFLPPILPGLSKQEVVDVMAESIETACATLGAS